MSKLPKLKNDRKTEEIVIKFKQTPRCTILLKNIKKRTTYAKNVETAASTRPLAGFLEKSVE